MSIKIHHGPNGSYKTSGAIQDDAIRALKEGRVIITNIRGFTLERAYQVFPDLPDSTDIVNLSLESLEDLEKMRSWFMWVPKGAFIIFDETQLVFPKSWRESDLKRFDFPGGPEAAHAADRPMGWLDAWTRHRHFGWDIVLTTPNVSYIRDDIRMTCEMAYKHSNLAVIGIPGRYKEAQHDAQLNRPPAEGTVIEYKRIRKQTFALYQSTATGTHQDTKAGKSLFRSPKLVFLLVLLASLIGFVVSMGPLRVIGGGGPSGGHDRADSSPVVPDNATASPSAVVPAARAVAPGAVPAAGFLGQPAAQPAALNSHPFADREIAVIGYLYDRNRGHFYLFSLTDPQGRRIELNSRQLAVSGYHFKGKGECLVEARYQHWAGVISCIGRVPDSPGSGGPGDSRSLLGGVLPREDLIAPVNNADAEYVPPPRTAP
ncbi:MAG: zonular occludens toxin domain-containing protein [Novosphingobium sp.]